MIQRKRTPDSKAALASNEIIGADFFNSIGQLLPACFAPIPGVSALSPVTRKRTYPVIALFAHRRIEGALEYRPSGYAGFQGQS